MRQAAIAGGIIVNKGRIVLVQQGGKTWSFPKGHVEKNESLLVAAKREIYEETSIRKVEMVKQFPSYRRIGSNHGVKEMKTMHFFLFKTSEEDLLPRDKDITQAKWIEIDKVATTITNEKDRKFFQSIASQLE